MDLQKEMVHLKKQSEYYHKTILAIIPSKIGYSELTSVIGPIMTLNRDSLLSMLLLAENKKYRDMIILSRSFLEAVINIGFICAEGDRAVLKAKKHAYQKGYRDLFRVIEINQIKLKKRLADFAIEIKKVIPKQMDEALQDFTSKNGKEISSWTPETVKVKIEIIGRSYGEYVTYLLTFAYFQIYRDVSEIIHNSYYGARIYIGMQNQDTSYFKSLKEVTDYFSDYEEKLATLILQQINVSINALLNIISQKFSTESTREIFKSSNDTLVEYAKSFDFK